MDILAFFLKKKEKHFCFYGLQDKYLFLHLSLCTIGFMKIDFYLLNIFTFYQHKDC